MSINFTFKLVPLDENSSYLVSSLSRHLIFPSKSQPD